MQSSLEVGDEVMLTSGIFGTVRIVGRRRGRSVEIARATVVEVARGAVGSKVVPGRRSPADDDGEPETLDPTTPGRHDHRGETEHGTQDPPGPGAPWLIFFGLAIAVLYGLVALGGTWKPDARAWTSQGGTRITPRPPPGNDVTAESARRGRATSSTSASTAPVSPRPR